MVVTAVWIESPTSCWLSWSRKRGRPWHRVQVPCRWWWRRRGGACSTLTAERVERVQLVALSTSPASSGDTGEDMPRPVPPLPCLQLLGLPSIPKPKTQNPKRKT